MVASLSSPAAPKVSDRLGSYHVHGPATAAYWLSPMERSQRVKQGVPAREVVTLADAMGLPRDQFMRVLGLARSTVERKITQRGPLSQAESEKLVGVERLIGQVDAMVREAGAAPDDAARLSQSLGLPKPPRSVTRHQTLGAIAAKINALGTDADTPAPSEPRRSDGRDARRDTNRRRDQGRGRDR